MSQNRDVGESVVDYRTYFFYKAILDFPSAPGERMQLRKSLIVLAPQVLVISLNLISALVVPHVPDKIENVKGALLVGLTVGVTINEYVNQGRMQRLLDYIRPQENHPRYGLLGETEILEKSFKTAKKGINVFMIIFAVNYPSMMLAKPLEAGLKGNSWKHLPFPWAWSDSSDLTFYASLILQTYVIFFCHSLGMLVTCLISSLSNQISALFDVVILSLEHIEERAARKQQEEGLLIEQSMRTCLKETVKHHIELLREYASIKPHLELPFLVVVTVISAVIACETLPFLLEDFTMALLVKHSTFLVVQVGSAASFCEMMESMAIRNTKVFDAFYGTPWYESDVKFQKLVLHGMICSTNPLFIHGVWFRNLKATRNFFSSMMISAYSTLNGIRNLV